MSDSKYFTFPLENLRTLNVFFGGRGIGKTFNFLKECVYKCKQTGKKFMYFRETEKIVQMVVAGNSIFNPIKEVDVSFPDIELISEKGFFTISEVNRISEDKKKYEIIQELGYVVAISTFHNARGLSFEDVDYIIFDEFIPEEGTVKRKNMDMLFLNMLETVNRNRELEGKPPVVVIMLTNANSPYSEYLSVFGIDEIIDKMQEATDQELQTTYDDGEIYVSFVSNAHFRNLKKNTFLYRRAKSQKFLAMALDNQFTVNTALIKKNPNMVKSKPILCVGSATTYVLYELADDTLIWRKGFNKGCTFYNIDNKQELMLFRFYFTDRLRRLYISGSMFFDSIYTMREVLEMGSIL